MRARLGLHRSELKLQVQAAELGLDPCGVKPPRGGVGGGLEAGRGGSQAPCGTRCISKPPATPPIRHDFVWSEEERREGYQEVAGSLWEALWAGPLGKLS
jgi:hypothetical protein